MINPYTMQVNLLRVQSSTFIALRNMSGLFLNSTKLNKNVLNLQYAVRGPLVIRASEIAKQLKQGVSKPFNNVIKANIGDAQAMGQNHITFIRQVLAVCTYPKLLESSEFPNDVKLRAKCILNDCSGGSLGSYSDSVGVEVIRRHVAEYIAERDGGIECSYSNIMLSGGASEAIKALLFLLNCSSQDGTRAGVMVPIPQYPLYSATIAEYDMHQIGYYLDEEGCWCLHTEELQRSLLAHRDTCSPRVLVVINPSNPTGSVLTRANIRAIIEFAYNNGLVILADEVYQHNVYSKDRAFYSFKQVLSQMGEPYNRIELASFMSCSKGYMGECGFRGGYCELLNFSDEVKTQLFKLLSAKLCSSLHGQVTMDCVVNPPRDGEPSHAQFVRERDNVLDTLALRASLVTDKLNSIAGITCQPVHGAMYAFPRIHLPERAVREASDRGMEADVFYAFELLEQTGVCIVPGSGFGQKPGTYHFRTTILPGPQLLDDMMGRIGQFHAQFMKRYT